MNQSSENRRPLSSRSTWWAQALCQKLAATSLTPNQISVASIGFALFAGGMFLVARLDMHWGFQCLALFLAALGIQGRLLCNMLDGMLAIESGRRSAVGELYNELPDRVADLIIIVAVGYSLPPDRTLILPGSTLGWLGATLAILTAYIRVLGASAGTQHFFLGPMAKPHRMALLTAAALVAAYEHGSGHFYYALPGALWIVILGSLATCARRIRAIAGALHTKTAP